MKAVVFESIGRVALAERPEPRVQDARDALVRVTAAGICGSDLHIVDGRDEGIRFGTIMGHELVGTVEGVGSAVSGVARGDRVVSPFSTCCGRCFFCARGLTARCVEARCLGVVNEDGSGLEGAQAEYVRVPFADATLVKLPETKSNGSRLADEEALLLGDVLSTAWATAGRADFRAGDVVAVVGCGPVGLLAALSALRLGASAVVAVDGVAYRRALAESFGALGAAPGTARSLLDARTAGRGADAVIEAVGSPGALDLAIALARSGATIAVAGYHTEATYPLRMPEAYTKNLSFRFGRASARAQIETLLPLVLDGSLDASRIVTHRLPLAEGVRGYEIFRNRDAGAVKVVLMPGA
jgi:2-desacetyl-2-hydroxyethyl bacteriochlorophyllide A dehydrogenase